MPFEGNWNKWFDRFGRETKPPAKPTETQGLVSAGSEGRAHENDFVRDAWATQQEQRTEQIRTRIEAIDKRLQEMAGQVTAGQGKAKVAGLKSLGLEIERAITEEKQVLLAEKQQLLTELDSIEKELSDRTAVV